MTPEPGNSRIVPHWLEQTAADLPAHDDWLSPVESSFQAGLRFAKRRSDWLLGRWTAKNAVAAYLERSADLHSLSSIEVRADASGAPVVYLEEEAAAVSISLSHSHGIAVCGVAAAGIALGCDLEIIEARSDSFVADYFTAEEQALIARTDSPSRSLIVTVLWCAKESALKALREGLRLDTRTLQVSGKAALQEETWFPLRVQHVDGASFHGWWQRAGDFVRTLVAVPAPAQPVALRSAQIP